MRHQPMTHQLDLLSSPAVETVQISPWQTLPEETHRRLTGLMVHLILNPADGDRAATGECGS